MARSDQIENVSPTSMTRRKRPPIKYILLIVWLFEVHLHSQGISASTDLAKLKKDQDLVDFRVANLLVDSGNHVTGVKLWHVPTGAPVFLLRIETVPQAFISVDTPATSNAGLAHALEHLLAGKGTKGRYETLLRDMRLGATNAATFKDFNYYSLSSGTGLEAFFEQLHAWLDALFRPDFTDLEAEREFYHIGVATDPETKKRYLIEAGTVYDEMQSEQGKDDYYYATNRHIFGEGNPLGFDPAGVVDEMRDVTPAQIRDFYRQHYRLGATTEFIFVIDAKTELVPFLKRVSKEFQPYSSSTKEAPKQDPDRSKPKYPIDPSEDTKVAIFPFPSANELVPGEILLSWRPVENSSPAELRLLRLFMDGFGNGERSLLHRALVDSQSRELESGATSVYSAVSIEDSPFFPASRIWISGIPGTKISEALIEKVRGGVSHKLREISEYPDGSKELLALNKVIAAEARAQHRSQIVWTKSPPLFGVSGSQTRWKDHLATLELDPGFARSLSEETAWSKVESSLKSNTNIWRDVILRFHLLDIPYATASRPSRELLGEMEAATHTRIAKATKQLMARYQTEDEQEALLRFEESERDKTREIDLIGSQVTRPTFTNDPPMTPDDDIRYRQFSLANVPVIASIFERPPTLDLGLSFDLSRIPRKYYRLLPLIPRCMDSLGLRLGQQVISYADLQGRIEEAAYQFSIQYSLDMRSPTSKLEIRASASDTASFRRTLDLIRELMRNNYLDDANSDRLRDVVAQKISSDDLYVRQAETDWINNPVFALRRSDDPLFWAVNSHFTRAHSDARLQWLLHKSVPSAQIDALSSFAGKFLADSSGLSREAFSQKLQNLKASGLEGELVEYWRRNLLAFPESELTNGLRQLAREVDEDLRTGPSETVQELRELQALILDRGALQIDVTVAPSSMDELRPDLIRFLNSIPDLKEQKEARSKADLPSPVTTTLSKTMAAAGFPSFLGFVTDSISGNAVFLADFPGYSQLDQKSLEQVLASNLLSGAGPSSLYMKTWDAGLAYSNGVIGDPDTEILTYYADRSPNLSALIQFVVKNAKDIEALRDDALLDYVLSQTFSFSREMLSSSRRGQLLARDLRDGVTPERVRRFSEAILALRKRPDLVHELKTVGFDSICGVLLTDACVKQQRRDHSIFFFLGSENVLNDAEKRLSIHGLLRLYPRDYWIE
jgi:Zn-dependent M16 (insulinase) family peptidase